MFSLIVATDLNNAIGKDNKIPWKLTDDLQFFKAVTYGKPIVMGRKTFESIGSKRLPGRDNVIISKHLKVKKGEVQTWDISFNKFDMKSLETYFKLNGDFCEICIIGGESIYKQALPFVQRIYHTRVRCMIDDADAFLPEYDRTDFKLISHLEFQSNARNEFGFDIDILERH